MFEYSEKVMNSFLHPRFVGEIDNADSVGDIGDVFCGDYLKVWLKIQNNIITDIKFKCFGCPAAIATSEALCELAINKTLEEAFKITDEMVIKYVFGLPDEKMHCSNLGATALKIAINNFKNGGHPINETM